MRPQLSLIGFCTLCIAVSEGNPFHSFIETIAPGMPHLLQNTQSVQASNKTDISRATHVLAVLSAPLQVVIVRRLLGSHSKHILVADKDIANQKVLSHRSLGFRLKVPATARGKARAPRERINIGIGTLICFIFTCGLIGFVRVSRKRRVAKQVAPFMTVPRGKKWGRAATHNWGADLKDKVKDKDDSDDFESLPTHKRSISEGGNPFGLVSSARKWKRVEMSRIVRHLRITGLDRQPIAPIGVVTGAVGVVKDRCDAINQDMQRYQCSNLRARADEIQKQIEKEGYIEELSKEFEHKVTRHEKQCKTITGVPVQFHGFNEEYLERERARRVTYAEGMIPHFGRTISEPEAVEEAEHDFISRLIAG